jgi:hypothetical protein
MKQRACGIQRGGAGALARDAKTPGFWATMQLAETFENCSSVPSVREEALYTVYTTKSTHELRYSL